MAVDPNETQKGFKHWEYQNIHIGERDGMAVVILNETGEVVTPTNVKDRKTAIRRTFANGKRN